MKHLSGSSATSIGDSWKSMCGKCSRKMRILSTILLLCSVLRTGTSLQLLRLDVPSIADPRWDKVVLKCEYDLGGEDLYSITWYKDGFQFFRYMPESQPSAREFPVTGVHVDLNRSDNKQVTLFGQNSLTRTGKVNLAGSYGCEVSSEAPSFQTIYGEANMSVAIPPKEPPSLHGLRPSYEAGETLFAECTSAPSYPPALLAFILNGKEVNKALTKELPGGSTSEESMVSSSRLRLTLRLERHHFPSGTLSLSCQSTLPGVAGTRPLERTETATLAANNQRLAQEPPRSDAGHQRPLLAGVVCCCVMAIARSASLW